MKIPGLCDDLVKASKSTVIFEQEETEPWPHGLEVNQELLTVSKGVLHRVNVTIHNNTNYQILLKGRTVLGRLDPVKSLV